MSENDPIPKTQEGYSARHDTEFEGEKWKHPYVLYIVLTAVLFGFLIFMGWLAWTQGWIPKR